MTAPATALDSAREAVALLSELLYSHGLRWKKDEERVRELLERINAQRGAGGAA